MVTIVLTNDVTGMANVVQVGDVMLVSRVASGGVSVRFYSTCPKGGIVGMRIWKIHQKIHWSLEENTLYIAVAFESQQRIVEVVEGLTGFRPRYKSTQLGDIEYVLERM